MRFLKERPFLALLLALVLLIPVTGLAALTGSSAISTWRERQAAIKVRDEIAAPSALMAARALVVNEGVASIAVSNARENGLGLARLKQLSGVDFEATLLAFSVGMKLTITVVNVVVGFLAIFLTLGTLRYRSVVSTPPPGSADEPG